MKKTIVLVFSACTLWLTVISQNVGIGTTTPLAKLEVVGNALISNGGPLRLRDNEVSNNSLIYFDLNNGTQQFQISHLPGNLYIQKIPATTIDWMMNATTGFVGMGTGSPAARLHLYSGSGEVLRLDAGSDPQLGLTQSGVLKGVLRLGGDDIVLGSPASNDLGKLIVRLNGADRMLVHPDGKVTIGTSNPATGYLLSVNGKAICSELKVQLQANWPDYVFNKNYQLKSFDELRKYIDANNHLPNMPPAAELEKNGMEVGEMQRKMMEKIEELTLYVLQLEKEVRSLKENKN
jgi:hypothetical protein